MFTAAINFPQSIYNRHCLIPCERGSAFSQPTRNILLISAQNPLCKLQNPHWSIT